MSVTASCDQRKTCGICGANSPQPRKKKDDNDEKIFCIGSNFRRCDTETMALRGGGIDHNVMVVGDDDDDDDALFTNLTGQFMNDLLADLTNVDNDIGVMNLEQLENELYYKYNNSNSNNNTMTEPAVSSSLQTPTTAAGWLFGQQPPPASTNLTTRSASDVLPQQQQHQQRHQSYDAWSLSLEKLTSSSLQEDFLLADSQKKKQQQQQLPLEQPLPTPPPPGMFDWNQMEEYDMNDFIPPIINSAPPAPPVATSTATAPSPPGLMIYPNNYYNEPVPNNDNNQDKRDNVDDVDADVDEVTPEIRSAFVSMFMQQQQQQQSHPHDPRQMLSLQDHPTPLQAPMTPQNSFSVLPSVSNHQQQRPMDMSTMMDALIEQDDDDVVVTTLPPVALPPMPEPASTPTAVQPDAPPKKQPPKKQQQQPQKTPPRQQQQQQQKVQNKKNNNKSTSAASMTTIQPTAILSRRPDAAVIPASGPTANAAMVAPPPAAAPPTTMMSPPSPQIIPIGVPVLQHPPPSNAWHQPPPPHMLPPQPQQPPPPVHHPSPVMVMPEPPSHPSSMMMMMPNQPVTVLTPPRPPMPLPPPPPPPPSKLLFCNPQYNASPIPAHMISSRDMKQRDITYVVHGILKSIILSEQDSNPNQRYDIQYYHKYIAPPMMMMMNNNPNYSGRSGILNQKIITNDPHYKNSATRGEEENVDVTNRKLTELEKRIQKAKEWSQSHSVLGHITKSDISRPRALISVATTITTSASSSSSSTLSDENSTGSRQARALLWKSRIYVDHAYQAYHTIMDIIWNENNNTAASSSLSEPSNVAIRIQPHLSKLFKCIGITNQNSTNSNTNNNSSSNLANMINESNSSGGVSSAFMIQYTCDHNVIQWILKLPKGKILVARILEQQILPLHVISIYIPSLLQILFQASPISNSLSSSVVADSSLVAAMEADDRIFSIITHILTTMHPILLSGSSILQCCQCIISNYHDNNNNKANSSNGATTVTSTTSSSLSTTKRMQCTLALLRMGGQLAATATESSSNDESSMLYLTEWKQMEETFLRILSGM